LLKINELIRLSPQSFGVLTRIPSHFHSLDDTTVWHDGIRGEAGRSADDDDATLERRLTAHLREKLSGRDPSS